jgi:hypothetical protein
MTQKAVATGGHNMSAKHSVKLQNNLINVVKSLRSRPVELRGPFKSGATVVSPKSEKK